MDDATLVSESLNGKTEARLHLAERWAGPILAYSYALTGQLEAAEKIAVETLLRGLQELPSLALPTRFAPLLVNIVNGLSRERGQPSRDGGATGADNQQLPGEVDILLQAVLALPEEWRLALVIRYFAQANYQTIALMLDLTIRSVNLRLVRGRGLLLSRLSGVPWSPPQGTALSLESLLSADLDHELSAMDQVTLNQLQTEHSREPLSTHLADLDRRLHACLSRNHPAIEHVVMQVHAHLTRPANRLCTLLVVDDEETLLPMISHLASPEFEVVTAQGAREAESILTRQSIDILLTDQRMPDRTGVQLLEWAREHSPRTIPLLMTGFSELEDAIEAINRGHVYYYLVKPWRNEDLLQILRNAADKFLLERERDRYLQELKQLNHELERRVIERTSELQEANQLLEQRARELERLALTDPLTGLFNRRAMEELASFELKRHERYPSPVAIGYIDIDFFKEINTRHLLTGGDQVLKGLARLLSATIREVDSVGRVGGEEFLVIARETHLAGAEVLAERLRLAVASTPFPVGDQSVSITISLGFAVAEGSINATYLQMADVAAAALAEAKEYGRNRWVIRAVQPARVP
ncbi:MAG: diguanylate cyclase [Gemmataceae bacterium]